MTTTEHLPILTFHSLDKAKEPVAFPPRLFQLCLDLLVEHGYRTLPLVEIVAHLRSGAGFPARSVAITFDDGYRSVFREAYPRLRQRGLSATLFLTTGPSRRTSDEQPFPSLCGREMLSWRDVAELAQAGWEIGAHTVSHADLGGLPAEQAIQEISGSMRAIEERLGTPVRVFAYPYGRTNPNVRGWLEGHVGCACGVSLGLVSSTSDPFALERLDMCYLRSRHLLPLLLSHWLPHYLRLRRGPRALRSAIETRFATLATRPR